MERDSNLSVNGLLYVVDNLALQYFHRSHLCYKSIINYDLDLMNILMVFPQIRYIEVFDITNPRFNEQIWLVPSDFVKSRFHCTNVCGIITLERGILLHFFHLFDCVVCRSSQPFTNHHPFWRPVTGRVYWTCMLKANNKHQNQDQAFSTFQRSFL